MTMGGSDVECVEQLADGVLASDPNTGRILAVNQTLCDLLGTTESAMRDSTLAAYTATAHHSNQPPVEERIDNARETTEQWTWPMHTASGDILSVTAHATVTERDGREVALTTVRPPTAGHEATTDHADARTRYRRILELSSDYVVILDETGTVEYVSPGVEEALGYTPAQIRGSDAFEYVLDADRPRVRSKFTDNLETPGATQRVEYRVRASDGSIRWSEARGGNYLDDPLIDGIMVTIRDVTERTEREQALHYRTALFEAITESIDAGVLVVGTDREILWYNTQFREMWDLPKDVLEDVPDNERAIEHVLDAVVDPAAFRDATKGLYEPPYEAARMEIELTDGRWFDRYTAPVVGEDGAHYGLLTLTRDVTDRMEYETRIETQNRRLERLADVIAHDMQTPLSTARRLLGMLDSELDEPGEPIPDSLDDLETALDRLQRFADHLPRLARESTDVETATECSLAAVAADAWAVTDTGDLALEVVDDRTLSGDPSRLQQLFENLFENAREYATQPAPFTRSQANETAETQQYTDTRPSSEGADSGPEDAHATAGATTVWVEPTPMGFAVADDGPGVPESIRDEIFEYGVSTGGSAGIGLAIVRSIVEAHGWSIRVIDRPGGGAKFVVETN